MPLQGEALSVLAALVWSFAVILFRQSGFAIGPLSLNLFKNMIAIILFVPTILLWADPFAGSGTPGDILILVLSGIVGITLADTLFLYSLNLIGAGLSAIVSCLYSPLVVFFSCLFLLEKISLMDFLGAALIVGAILVTAERGKGRVERKQLVFGILLGAASMALMAIGVIMFKPVLHTTSVLWATFIRLVGGEVFLLLFCLEQRQRRKLLSVFRPQRSWRVGVPASVLGAYVAMIIWIAGMKYTQASIAAILNQLSTIFTVVLAFFLLREALTRRKLIAVVMSLVGACFVFL